MPRKKKETGDPFFDQPAKEYWKGKESSASFDASIVSTSQVGPGSYPAESLKPTRTPPQKFRSPEVESNDALLNAPDDTDGIKELNKLYVPLTDLRMRIVELQNMGIKKIPMGALLIEIRKVYRASIESDE